MLAKFLSHYMDSPIDVDFIGIGTPKSGSTWLADCLAGHPEICFSKMKELHFFDERGSSYFIRKIVSNYTYENCGKSWYDKQFAHCSKDSIKGEFTPSYIYCPTALKRIKERCMNVKLIVVLRDPVARAFSQYLNDIRAGGIKNIPFEEALCKYDNYVEKGLYYKYLKDWYHHFGKENILVATFDEIKENPKNLLRKVFSFLGVKNIDYIPECFNKKSNEAKRGLFPLVSYFLVRIKLFLRENNMKRVLWILDKFKLKKLAYFIITRNTISLKSYPMISEETGKKIKKNFFN